MLEAGVTEIAGRATTSSKLTCTSIVPSQQSGRVSVPDTVSKGASYRRPAFASIFSGRVFNLALLDRNSPPLGSRPAMSHCHHLEITIEFQAC